MALTLQPNVRKFIDELGPLPRICLVKQAVYKDLYNARTGTGPKDLLLSSNMRTGPAGLLAAFPVDFRILRVSSEPECSLWQQKITDCRHGDLAMYQANGSRAFRQIDGSTRVQNDLAEDADDVDWSSYDLVISYDIAVPSRICRKHPEVYWSYYITEGCMTEFRESLRRPIDGYRAYFNHHFRLDEHRAHPLHGTPLGSHVFEIPYFIHYAGCFHDLLGKPAFDAPRSGILLDRRAKHLLSDAQLKVLERFGPVRNVGGFVWHMLDMLMAAKYYVRLGNHPVLGNSSIEAIAAGALHVGSPHGIKNRSLLNPQSMLSTAEFGERQFAELVERLEMFESDRDAFELALREQRDRVDTLCFFRPVSELLADYRKFRASRA